MTRAESEGRWRAAGVISGCPLLEARAAYLSMPEIIRSSAKSKRSSGLYRRSGRATRGCAGTVSAGRTDVAPEHLDDLFGRDVFAGGGGDAEALLEAEGPDVKTGNVAYIGNGGVRDPNGLEECEEPFDQQGHLWPGGHSTERYPARRRGAC